MYGALFSHLFIMLQLDIRDMQNQTNTTMYKNQN
jgi:hypothetical protein